MQAPRAPPPAARRLGGRRSCVGLRRVGRGATPGSGDIRVGGTDERAIEDEAGTVRPGSMTTLLEEIARGPAEAAGGGSAREQEGGALVHVHDRVQELRVGEADHPVLGRDGRERRGVLAVAEPGKRVAGGDGGARGGKGAEFAPVFGEREPAGGAEGVLVERIALDRAGRPVAGLELADAGTGVAARPLPSYGAPGLRAARYSGLRQTMNAALLSHEASVT